MNDMMSRVMRKKLNSIKLNIAHGTSNLKENRHEVSIRVELCFSRLILINEAMIWCVKFWLYEALINCRLVKLFKQSSNCCDMAKSKPDFGWLCMSWCFATDVELKVGFVTKSKLNALDLTEYDKRRFYQGCRAFYLQAAKYAQKWFPLKDEVLRNARFVNYKNRSSATFEQVLYFAER